MFDFASDSNRLGFRYLLDSSYNLVISDVILYVDGISPLELRLQGARPYSLRTVWPQLYCEANLRTIVYVDGFNLYYGALRKTPFKWLDLELLCRVILKNVSITRIKYFTARVAPRPNDPDQAVRQDMYLRALALNPKIEAHFGHFLSHPVRMPLCDTGGVITGQYASVLKTEEKGSDVNLAAHMLLDAHKNAFDQAIIISNDSDLLTPIRFVRREFKKRVGILNPHQRQSQVLSREADFVRQIRRGALEASQYPDQLTDRNGTFSRPRRWK